VISYSFYLIFSQETVSALGEEDGFFEYSTALFFFLTSIICLKLFLNNKNYWFLILLLLFFLGFGEEISWGQRIFGFETPDFVKENNVQKEFSIHNLELF
jgi:hypothetical protein